MKKKKTQEKEHNLEKIIKEIETKEEKREKDIKFLQEKNQELILLREKGMEGLTCSYYAWKY